MSASISRTCVWLLRIADHRSEIPVFGLTASTDEKSDIFHFMETAYLKTGLLKEVRKIIINGLMPWGKSDRVFTIPANFIRHERYENLGAAIILWLSLVIEQQARKRRIRKADGTIANWLKTSRATISKYKGILKDLGFLNIDTSHKQQVVSVNYFPR